MLRTHRAHKHKFNVAKENTERVRWWSWYKHTHTRILLKWARSGASQNESHRIAYTGLVGRSFRQLFLGGMEEARTQDHTHTHPRNQNVLGATWEKATNKTRK